MKRLFLALVGLALLGACAPTTTTEGPKAPTPPPKAPTPPPVNIPMPEEEAKQAVAELLRPFLEVDLDLLVASREARACYSFTLDTNSLSFKRIAENKDKVREKLLPKWRGIAEPAKAFVAEIEDHRYAFYEMTKKERSSLPLPLYIRDVDVEVWVRMPYKGQTRTVAFDLVENFSWKEGPRYCLSYMEFHLPDTGEGLLRANAIASEFTRDAARAAEEVAQGK